MLSAVASVWAIKNISMNHLDYVFQMCLESIAFSYNYRISIAYINNA